MRYIPLAALALAAFLLPSPVQAANVLKPQQVQNFVASMESVNTLSDEMKETGKNEKLIAKVQSTDANAFAPYTKAVEVMKSDFPADYAKLGDIVKKHGFSSQEQWAQTGNDVIISHLAAETTPEGMQEMQAARENVTPEIMAAMPPEARESLTRMALVMDAIKGVPPQNIEAVKPFAEQLNAEMNPDSQ